MQKWSITGRSLALSALALALTACQSMRGPEPTVQVEMPAGYATLGSSSETSIAAQGYKDFFADQRLQQVIDLALTNNRDLRIAALNIQRAQSQYQISENNQLPTVGASAGATRQVSRSAYGATAPTTIYNVGLGVTAFELDFWGRVRSLKDAALDNYLATQSARDNVQIALIAQTAQAWLNYAYANANLKLAEQTLKAQQDSYALNKRRFDVGVDSEVPLRQAQVSVEVAKNDVANFKTQIQQAKNLLDLLVGQNVSEDLLSKQHVKSVTNTTVLNAGLPSDLLNQRPDIRATEYQLSAAGANIGVAKAALFPRISLTGSAGLASTELSDLFQSSNRVWSIGPSLDIPIFDWGTRRANINITETDQKIALANYEKSIQTAFREVNDVLATRQHIDERLAAQRRLVEATNTTYTLSNARFRAGIDSFLTVLDAQRSAYASEQGLLALEQANLNSQIELYKALGGGVKATSDQTLDQQPSSSARHYAD